jgi:hypothetical protein
MCKCVWCEKSFDCGSFKNTASNKYKFCSLRCESTAKTNGVVINKKEGCFIATAAYGDYDHPIVLDLRNFRDNWLDNRIWGKKFISKYYQHGPKLANIIYESLTLKKTTLFFLIKPLHFIVVSLKLNKK